MGQVTWDGVLYAGLIKSLTRTTTHTLLISPISHYQSKSQVTMTKSFDAPATPEKRKRQEYPEWELFWGYSLENIPSLPNPPKKLKSILKRSSTRIRIRKISMGFEIEEKNCFKKLRFIDEIESRK